MLDRREFLEALGAPACAAALAGTAMLSLTPDADASARLAGLASAGGSPDELARDEDFWFEVGRAFTVDRAFINLNNGGVCPAPAMVQQAMQRRLEISNSMPPAYALWQLLEPQKEQVRERLAAEFGCDKEELAITRNASESLETCLFGFDLKPGDEILTTTQDYPRMLWTIRQRERRERIASRQIKIPVPCEDPARIVSLFADAITPKTRLLLMSHAINITGQILPVRDVVAMARKKNVPVIVDGAHSLAQFEFKIADLDCDYFGSSLHKWLLAPHGTGMLYVRRDKIKSLWPLMPGPPEVDDSNVRKFEEIGTHPAANILSINEALTFHQGIGAKRKEARLRFLRDTWAHRLLQNSRVRLHTSLKPEFSCAIGTVQIEGIDSKKLAEWLFKTHRILVTEIIHPEFEGIRVTPNVYTQMSEIDRFCDKMEWVIKNGLPA